MLKNTIGNCSYLFSNGVTVVNTTPHPISRQTPERNLVSIPSDPSMLVNAKAEEQQVSNLFVRTAFKGTPDGLTLIKEIKSWAEGESVSCLVIVGSIIAAQAYPGEVCGLCPVPGFERVAPSEKRMRCDKFTVY